MLSNFFDICTVPFDDKILIFESKIAGIQCYKAVNFAGKLKLKAIQKS